MSDDLRVLRELAEAAPKQPTTNANVVGVHLNSRHHLTIRPDVLLALLDRLEAAEAAVERVRALADEWRSLPVWGPDERGLMILDCVDHDGIMRELHAALDAD